MYDAANVNPQLSSQFRQQHNLITIKWAKVV